VSLLSEPLPLADVENAELLCRKVLEDWLRSKGAWLNEHEYDDALSYLLAEAWKLSRRFDPAKGTRSFSTFAFRILWKRVPSWYRQRFGDTRYRTAAELVAFDEDHDDVAALTYEQPAGDVEVFTRINVERLSPDGRMVLERIVMPMVEDGLSLEQVADRFGYSRRWVSRAIDRLRQELAYVVETT
jgi:RNA polymerase sigma factor (sigma-70 family)